MWRIALGIVLGGSITALAQDVFSIPIENAVYIGFGPDGHSRSAKFDLDGNVICVPPWDVKDAEGIIHGYSLKK